MPFGARLVGLGGVVLARRSVRGSDYGDGEMATWVNVLASWCVTMGRSRCGGEMPVDAMFPYRKLTQVIDGVPTAYVDVGEGDPIVFLHGNPTSSYLWRNVVPHVAGLGRCILPDLVGMGDSAKLPDADAFSYRFVEHRRYLDGLLDALGVDSDVTVVGHDWGSALGFDWANRHRGAVAGIVYMEAIVRPLRWDEWPEQARSIFAGFRSAAGEEMVLDKNLFVEAVLPASVIRQLSDDEMAEYRRPFAEPGESRRPTLTWPRQIPLDEDPADVSEIVAAYADWLATSDVPKLLIVADPGAILTGAQLEFCRRWPNQREVTVAGNHFVQEDSPDEIGAAIATWMTDRDTATA
jgi:haloalkane dehalogenase